jgi:signal transduction histidine kinase
MWGNAQTTNTWFRTLQLPRVQRAKRYTMHREAIDAALATVANSDSIGTLLLLASEIAGSNTVLLARVSDDLWTVSATHALGTVGSTDSQLHVGQPVRLKLGLMNLPISIAPMGPQTGATQTASSIACGVAAPIILRSGRYFGVLCALDPTALNHSDDRMESKFQCLASVVASQIDQLELRDLEKSAFLDERSAGQLREQFIAILGHDLRNPLQAIFASSDLLMRQVVHPAHAQMAGRIKTNARRMASLIDDVLDFARGRLGGGINVELTEVENISAGLMTVVQEFQDTQAYCQILADFQVTRSVRCDLGRLQQVASNLLGNALTHGQPNQPIRISARNDEHDLVLEVWNTGDPIPAESLSKIFEPFWRHSVSASRNGLGLGLHICSQIVRAHHGRISVTSTREGGTQFTARLPLSLQMPSQLTLPSAAATSRTGAGQSMSACS